MLRPANLTDLDGLIQLETTSFDSDQISRRSFRYLLTKGKAETWLDEESGEIRGYAIVLFNSGTSSARLYSIAVQPQSRGKGIAERLIRKIEETSLEKDFIYLRLEVRKDNLPAQNLYQKLGYKKIEIVKEYYEDKMDAQRFEKLLAPHLNPDLARVPYYHQTLDFTCGPAAVMMAMHALEPRFELDRKTELRIWREATTIFMTSGHGGCGPYGLALAVKKRGFDVDLYVNDEGPLFLDSVRDPEKKEVLRLVQEDFRSEIDKLGITVHHGNLRALDLKEKFEEGGIPVVLISMYKMINMKAPHWVIITGFDDKYLYFHDPYTDIDRPPSDCTYSPILQKDFERMARYGKSSQKAALIIKRPKT
ncbi:MAG: GNAT family N-acetyltransferase/peptidase C39 family protein [Leptospiraceae bacterium]|nr:GNAT family N-acetyltransferase/peptidase C39 family protein [Leptospiraceae bacterium]MCP5513151.1 GNAT family N-acetyltransferase/peptidase C39 family protein [Leptospiraceae bacterium]